MKPAWGWGSRINAQLLADGLDTVSALFRGDVLDLGCGMKPYEAQLAADGCRWIGVDYERTPSGRSRADVFGSAMAIPFAAERFDCVLCTQVLEHVPRPLDVLHEAHRVLKPGGTLVVTAPQTGPLHEEPHDYQRFTCYGLSLLGRNAGFDVVETRPLGGAIATIGQMVMWHLNWMARFPVIGPPSQRVVNAVLWRLALLLDPLSSAAGTGGSKDTLNWLMIATRPDRERSSGAGHEAARSRLPS